MKILFFINGIHPGGKERRMLELMKEIKKWPDFDFELVVMNEEINYPEVFNLATKIHFLLRKSKKDVSIFHKFYKICRNYRPDIVHCWDGMTAVYSIAACKLLNIKLINGMVVDTPVQKNIFNKNWLRAQLTFPFSDKVIGNSLAGLKAYRAPLKKSICIYNGMDLRRFTGLQEPSTIRNEFFGRTCDDLYIVGMVAAFEDRKDYQTLIRSALELVTTYDNLRFLLIGGGSRLEESKAMVPQDLLNRIIFTGKQSNVESIINIFDVGVLLTNTEIHGEGISNSIIEYMALKKPVIATKGGGTGEVVVEGQNGYLIDNAATGQLKEKLVALMTHPCSGIEMGENGYRLVIERLDLKIMSRQYHEVYNKLLN